MGPNTLFDKSFLQSLSIDESVWFDHFFLANICPLFYVETLADLDKAVIKERTPEQEVGIIADKFPEMHGAPNVHHARLYINDLLGSKIPMTGQIPVAGGRPVKSDGKTGVVFEPSPEAEVFSRWHNREFMEIERRYARGWRVALSTLDLNAIAENFRTLGITGKSCNTLEDAKALAEHIVARRDKPVVFMELIFQFLSIPQQYRKPIWERWSTTNYQPLTEYAPYAAHVLTVELFFQIALAANLISSKPPSNRVDIAYLFYLPFCKLFVSSDRLHRRCASSFLRENQEFVWGPMLKNGLSQLNDFYLQLSNNIKNKGVMAFAGVPPKDGDYYVAKLWDRHFPGWREEKNTDLAEKSSDDPTIVEKVKKMADAQGLSSNDSDFDPTDPKSVLIKRNVRRMKGSWYQVPKDLKDTAG
ncbi:MAG: hypothetical protein WBB67_02765 [bacterium]